MHGEGFFYQAFIYLGAAVVAVPLAKRLGLGSVLGYLVAGTIIGPFGMGFIGEEGRDVMHFAEFGVVMMLFIVGLELQPSRLWRLRSSLLGMGGLQVGLTTAAAFVIGLAAGLEWRASLAIGMILSLSSTAIVLQTLDEKGLMRTDSGQNSFSVLLFQDIAVIPMLAIFPLLATGGLDPAQTSDHGAGWLEMLPGWARALVVPGAVAIIVPVGRFLIRPCFRFIARTRLSELFTAATLLLVIGIAMLMSTVGLSPALGTFLAGVVLSDSEYRHELESDLGPFKGLLLGLFFIAVGASIDFGLVVDRPVLMGGLVGSLVLVKLLILLAVGRMFRMGLDQNLLMAFALAQGGEFAFVLFSFAARNGVVPGDLTAILMAAVALSMVLTPLLMMVNEKLLQPRFGTKEQRETSVDLEGENPVIVAGFGRFGNIVGRLLRANGVGTTVLDLDSDNVDMLRKLGMKVFYGDASRRDLLQSAGADSAKVLVLAIDDLEKTVEIHDTVRRHFPNLEVVARADNRSQAYEMLESGIEHVYRETLDTSLRMGVDVLRMLGFRSYQAHRSSLTFRRHDEESVRELASRRHDRKEYISLARQRIRDLETILQKELETPGEERDAGWDTTTIIAEFGKAENSETAR